MISVVISSHFAECENEKFKKHISETIGCNHEILLYENKNQYSLSEIYNKGIADSKFDIVCFLHNDITINTNDWGKEVVRDFCFNEHGIIGVAGSKFVPKSGCWWEVREALYGKIKHELKSGNRQTNFSEKLSKIEDVVCIDGVFIAVQKSRIKHNFDTQFKGFHFYDVGFCAKNYLSGVGIGITTNIEITHKSGGNVSEEWEKNRKLFEKTYKDTLPFSNIQYLDIETFIVCHDQELILRFEKIGKFNQFKKLRYVFVGNGNCEKIRNEKVIIARELPHNIESQKNYCAYTAWYALWKNQLIKTTYINLFEYDINLTPYIAEHTTKHLQEMGIVGYVPMSSKIHEFINDERLVKGIFRAIQQEHQRNTKKFLDSQYSHEFMWLTTNNVSFHQFEFNQYMKWVEPILKNSYLKNDVWAGHGLERALTFYCLMYNKKVALIPKIIKHFQMNSHSTQNHTPESLEKLFS